MNVSEIFSEYFDCEATCDVETFYNDDYYDWDQYSEHYDAVHGD